ncbi:MAG: hypothetical protein NT077_02850 [Candidatus Taylorbacteria bacterium]|nr:hypothetical protein [Candidatus Taylorbacteria bacterium]
MARNSILILSVVLIGVGLVFWRSGMSGSVSRINPSVACTAEAKICPDGSAVGRTGPLCEFAACPNVTNPANAVVRGSVALSPVCSVERIPPDPQCAPKPYVTRIKVLDVNGGMLVKTIQSLNDGSFTLTLPYGNYTLQAAGGNPLPRCSPITLSVQTSIVNEVSISCDTGIR